MLEVAKKDDIDWEAIYEAERFRLPVRELSPDVARHFAWEGWNNEHKIPAQWLIHHAQAFHFSDAEILAARTTRDMPATAGVYFLFDGNECIYVGQSQCLRDRAMQHRDGGKRWNSHSYIEVPAMHVKTVEAYYIRRIDPPLNNMFPPDRTYADIVRGLGLDGEPPAPIKQRVIVVRRQLPTITDHS